jgi:hypothetical protein
MKIGVFNRCLCKTIDGAQPNNSQSLIIVQNGYAACNLVASTIEMRRALGVCAEFGPKKVFVVGSFLVYAVAIAVSWETSPTDDTASFTICTIYDISMQPPVLLPGKLVIVHDVESAAARAWTSMVLDIRFRANFLEVKDLDSLWSSTQLNVCRH